MDHSSPWTDAGRFHSELHELTAPDWLPDAPVGRGVGLLHLDLHPLNVMMSPRGPVVIDWARACRGDPAVDVALAWILMAAGEVPTGRLMGMILGRARSTLVKSFLVRLRSMRSGPFFLMWSHGRSQIPTFLRLNKPVCGGW